MVAEGALRAVEGRVGVGPSVGEGRARGNCIILTIRLGLALLFGGNSKIGLLLKGLRHGSGTANSRLRSFNEMRANSFRGYRGGNNPTKPFMVCLHSGPPIRSIQFVQTTLLRQIASG